MGARAFLTRVKPSRYSMVELKCEKFELAHLSALFVRAYKRARASFLMSARLNFKFIDKQCCL